MNLLEIDIQSLKKVDVVKIKGRVDSSNVAEFETALAGLQQQGRHCIVLDMTELNYMSSAGLRAMVTALKAAKGKAGNVVIAAPTPNMVDTLKLVGFQSLFPQYDDVLKAVDSF